MKGKIPFSEQQRAAIDTDGNVIVSAGAGSGKTTVMIERIVKKLLGGAKLDRMLIVTFTRAAAADIRVKLAERLSALKRYGDGDEAEIAQEALQSLPVCSIGTLHSFCQRLIKNYFYAAEIDPSAAVLDEAEAAAHKTECIAQAIRAARERGNENFRIMSDALCTRRDDGGMTDAIRRILDFALSLSDPMGYLDNVKSDRASDAALDEILKVRRETLSAEIDLLQSDIAAAGFSAIQKAAGELGLYLDGKIDEVTRTSHRAKGDMRDVLNDRFKELKKACKDYRESVDTAVRAKAVDSAPYVAALCGAAIDALERYNRRKAALGKIDYSDLEHGAYNVLCDGKCLSEIAASLDYVFIDEYQDVNPLQADIAQKLKSGAGAEMFLVGDIKQSIYGFRRCDPIYFKSTLDDPDFTHIVLNNNYRSSKEVIDFVNKVFTGVMKDGFGGADYRDDLVCMNKSSGAATFFGVEDRSPQKDGAARTDEVYSVMRAVRDGEAPMPEARFTVNAVLDYIQGGEGRRYSDIAVLVRSARTPFCEQLVKLMRGCGIPVCLGRKSSISDYPEARALADIARCVDNRYDDVALYTALRSPMGGFSDAELLEIAEDGNKNAVAAGVKGVYGTLKKSLCFWQKVKSYKGVYRERLDAFAARRQRFYEYSCRHDAADTLGYITSDIDYFQYVFEHGGNAAAVEALIADATARRSDLCTYLASIDGDTELAVSDGGDAVTVTTVHAAKGLEYEFVIVADTAHKFNMRDASCRVMALDGGVAVKYADPVSHTLIPSVPWLVGNATVPDRLREEELRLFYVALTRAKRYLAVCGVEKNGVKDVKSATCEYDFMKNMLPVPADVSEREKPISDKAPVPLSDAITRAVKDVCGFEYAKSDLPIKTCVTAIAEMSDEDYTSAAPVLTRDDNEAAADSVSGKRRVGTGGTANVGKEDARLRGTAYHRAMELIDFASPDIAAVKAACENSELVNFDEISKAAAAMKELIGDSTYYKERYFIADIPIESASPVAARGASVLVQGVIDLLIVDGGGNATIVDYKTTDPAHLLNDGYRTQLDMYARAVERVTPFKAVRKCLYSFELGKLIDV